VVVVRAITARACSAGVEGARCVIGGLDSDSRLFHDDRVADFLEGRIVENGSELGNDREISWI